MPAVALRIPPPGERMQQHKRRLQGLYDRLKKLWMDEHRLMSTIGLIRGWDLETFLSIPPDQREAILKALNDDSQKLLRELDPNDPLALRLREELRAANEWFYKLMRDAEKANEPDKSSLFEEKLTLLLTNLEEFQRNLLARMQQHIPRHQDQMEEQIVEHKKFEDDLQALDNEIAMVQELFQQIENPSPLERSKMDKLMSTWEGIWENSRAYVERLKAVEGILNGVIESEVTIRDHEVTLASYDTLPADLPGLRAVHASLLECQLIMQQQQTLFEGLRRDMGVARQHVARTRPQQGAHPDVDRLEERVHKVIVRWENVTAQITERLRTTESAINIVMVYRSEYDNEIAWLDRVEKTIQQLREPGDLNPAEYQAQLDLLMRPTAEQAVSQPSLTGPPNGPVPDVVNVIINRGDKGIGLSIVSIEVGLSSLFRPTAEQAVSQPSLTGPPNGPVPDVVNVIINRGDKGIGLSIVSIEVGLSSLFRPTAEQAVSQPSLTGPPNGPVPDVVNVIINRGDKGIGLSIVSIEVGLSSLFRPTAEQAVSQPSLTGPPNGPVPDVVNVIINRGDKGIGLSIVSIEVGLSSLFRPTAEQAVSQPSLTGPPNGPVPDVVNVIINRGDKGIGLSIVSIEVGLSSLFRPTAEQAVSQPSLTGPPNGPVPDVVNVIINRGDKGIGLSIVSIEVGLSSLFRPTAEQAVSQPSLTGPPNGPVPDVVNVIINRGDKGIGLSIVSIEVGLSSLFRPTAEQAVSQPSLTGPPNGPVPDVVNVIINRGDKGIGLSIVSIEVGLSSLFRPTAEQAVSQPSLTGPPNGPVPDVVNVIINRGDKGIGLSIVSIEVGLSSLFRPTAEQAVSQPSLTGPPNGPVPDVVNVIINRGDKGIGLSIVSIEVGLSSLFRPTAEQAVSQPSLTGPPNGPVPDVVNVIINRGDKGIGLSIVSIEASDSQEIGIFVKKIVEGNKSNPAIISEAQAQRACEAQQQYPSGNRSMSALPVNVMTHEDIGHPASLQGYRNGSVNGSVRAAPPPYAGQVTPSAELTQPNAHNRTLSTSNLKDDRHHPQHPSNRRFPPGVVGPQVLPTMGNGGPPPVMPKRSPGTLPRTTGTGTSPGYYHPDTIQRQQQHHSVGELDHRIHAEPQYHNLGNYRMSEGQTPTGEHVPRASGPSPSPLQSVAHHHQQYTSPRQVTGPYQAQSLSSGRSMTSTTTPTTPIWVGAGQHQRTPEVDHRATPTLGSVRKSPLPHQGPAVLAHPHQRYAVPPSGQEHRPYSPRTEEPPQGQYDAGRIVRAVTFEFHKLPAPAMDRIISFMYKRHGWKDLLRLRLVAKFLDTQIFLLLRTARIGEWDYCAALRANCAGYMSASNKSEMTKKVIDDYLMYFLPRLSPCVVEIFFPRNVLHTAGFFCHETVPNGRPSFYCQPMKLGGPLRSVERLILQICSMECCPIVRQLINRRNVSLTPALQDLTVTFLHANEDVAVRPDWRCFKYRPCDLDSFWEELGWEPPKWENYEPIASPVCGTEVNMIPI